MASIQSSAENALRQVRDMTLSQKIAIALGVILVAGSLGWLAQWAAAPEMTPLISGPIESEEYARLRTGLDIIGEPYKEEGDMLLVRASANKHGLIARLTQMDMMPADTSLTYEQLIKDANPFLSQAENERRWILATRNHIERVLRSLDGVQSADVLLNVGEGRRMFAKNRPEPTASVTLKMKGAMPVTRELALAGARAVSGAIRGMKVSNVSVIDAGNGKPALDWEDEDSSSATRIEHRRRALERETEQKIRQQLASDSSALVSVRAELDYTQRNTESLEPIEGVEITRRTSERQTSRARQSGQPGVQPNTGAAIGGGGNADTDRSETSDVELAPGHKKTHEQTPAGEPTRIFAAVSLSHTYLAGIYKRQNPDAEAPTEPEIERLFLTQKKRIQDRLALLVKPQVPEQVAVDWYYDVLDDNPPAMESAVAGSLEVAGRYAPMGALALLAMVSLGLMLRMSRQSNLGEAFGIEIGMPKEALEAARRAAADLKAGGGGSGGVGGDAGFAGMDPSLVPTGESADGLLDAQEIDERHVQINSMLEQVETSFAEDEDGVTALVERWVEGRG